MANVGSLGGFIAEVNRLGPKILHLNFCSAVNFVVFITIRPSITIC